MAVEVQKLYERLAADLAKGDRETALRAYVDATSWPDRWDELTPERKSSFFDDVATAIQAEVRPFLSGEAIGRRSE
jgi:hypothetical protein